MIDWLYSLPEILLLVAGALLMAGAILLLPSLVHRLPYLRTSNENNDFVLRMQATLFTMTSLVLAFTLVEAENNFRKADLLVATEASQINRLDRLLSRYGDDSATDLRRHLLAYAKAIVDDEWPAMLHGGRSDKVRLALTPLSRGIFEIEPRPGRETTIYAEILRSFDTIAESRDAPGSMPSPSRCPSATGRSSCSPSSCCSSSPVPWDAAPSAPTCSPPRWR